MASNITTGRIKRVLVAGAGPAGSSLAIRLANSGLDVVLVERETFPRHKLCGEFISPECLRHFDEIGVSPGILKSGGDRILNTVFYSPDGRSVDIPSEWFEKNAGGALGLSRARMDLLLIEKAKACGVEVLENTSVRELRFDNQSIQTAVCTTGNGDRLDIAADLYVDATGRARVLSKLASKVTGRNRSSKEKWIGFKSHFQEVDMDPGRCEIYLFDGGYGGLNFVEEGTANHCFLVKSEVVRKLHGNGEAVFREAVLSNQRARKTLSKAKRDFDWIAVSVDEFGVKDLTPAGNLLSVGDAGAFIDPFTGSGMLMALESAEIMADCIINGTGNYADLGFEYVAKHRQTFAKRLRISAIMRRISFSKHVASFVFNGLRLSSPVRLAVAKATRLGGTKSTAKL
jgi:flavin-dependent dehydrogenase